ncbi:MAG: hypothetical protein AB1760_20460 [Pseudomonadota bacterium]
MNATTLLASILGAAFVATLGIALQVIIRMVGRLEKAMDHLGDQMSTLSREFANFRTEMAEELGKLRTEVSQEVAGVRTTLARLDAEVAGLRRDVDALARRLETTPTPQS